MTTKLTLSLNLNTIKKAKRISHIRKISVSKMVEEYFNSLAVKEENEVSPMDRINQIVDAHTGIKNKYDTVEYKKILSDWRLEDLEKALPKKK
jgi:hypothetical protein